MPYGFAYNDLFVLFDRAPFLQFHSVSGRLGTFSFPQAVVLFGCGVLGRLFPLYNPVHGYVSGCAVALISVIFLYAAIVLSIHDLEKFCILQ